MTNNNSFKLLGIKKHAFHDKQQNMQDVTQTVCMLNFLFTRFCCNRHCCVI